MSIYQHFVHFSNCIQLCIILIMQQFYFFFFLACRKSSWLSKSIFLTLFSLFRNSFKFHIMTAVWLSWNANILYTTRNKGLRLCWRPTHFFSNVMFGYYRHLVARHEVGDTRLEEHVVPCRTNSYSVTRSDNGLTFLVSLTNMHLYFSLNTNTFF